MKRSILLLVLVPVFVGCGKESAPAAKVERPALTMVVGSAATAGGNTYSGEIRARHEAQLGFRIGGKIIERLVDAGTQVRAGQVLMRLDPGDTGLQLDSAEAQYQLAEADAKAQLRLVARANLAAIDIAASGRGRTHHQGQSRPLDSCRRSRFLAAPGKYGYKDE